MISHASNAPILIRLGREWFKYRSFSPLPFMALVLILPPDFRLSWVSFLCFTLLLVIAESIRIWSVGYAGSATRTRGEEVNNFVHAGPYRWVRNPIYLGNIMLYLSFSLLFGFLYLTCFAAIYFALQYSLIVMFEEEVLRVKFKAAYIHYVSCVPRWWIAFPPYPKSNHTFQLKEALRSERSTVYAIISVAALLYLKSVFIV